MAEPALAREEVASVEDLTGNFGLTGQGLDGNPLDLEQPPHDLKVPLTHY